jgi:iron(II)-dependent oxidoreductase
LLATGNWKLETDKMPTTPAIDTTAAIDWYRRNRARSEAIFDLIDPAAYYSRPISLRNPIVFYEGHLPAFSVIAFLRRGLGKPPVDARLEGLFERGIDPETEASAVPRSGASTVWPTRDEVRAFARACDDAVVAAMRSLSSGPLPLEGLYTALEHEAMHQETLLYMWHRLPYAQKRGQTPFLQIHGGASSAPSTQDPQQSSRSSHTRRGQTPIPIPPGTATLGVNRDEIPFGWDNEFDAHRVAVAAFDVDAMPVTNAQFLEFVNAGGYTQRALWDDEGWTWIQQDRVQYPSFWTPASGQEQRAWKWRGMFEEIALPADWPVYVSHAEASAYAWWKGRRLMTEPEFHRAAYGTPGGTQRPHPWGEAAPDATRGHFDFTGFDPAPVGSHPAGASAWGVQDLVGNGWEWTSTLFAPFDGFAAMASYPEYSADFFDGRHYVMKGASPGTAKELIRCSFRNWFRGNYPYVYAKFRTVA